MFGVKDLGKRIIILSLVILPWEIALVYAFYEFI